MENGGISSKWRKRLTPNHQNPTKSKLFTLALLCSCALLLLVSSSKRLLPQSLLSISRNSQQVGSLPLQCRRDRLDPTTKRREKFLWYATHIGFTKQLSEFKNGLLMFAILDRTLIVPPVLYHHAMALGSCPKFRALNPSELRFSIWNHSLDLFRDHRYVSMTDIVDVSVRYLGR